MPNFNTHLNSSAVLGLGYVSYGAFYCGWGLKTSLVAFSATLLGGLVPDLDSDQSRPLRMTAALSGLILAIFTYDYLSAAAIQVFNHNFSQLEMLLIALTVCFIFNTAVLFVFRKYTTHRGLFHSFAVPFLYGGILALFLFPSDNKKAKIVCLGAILGVFSHLILDCVKSRSLNPLKFFSKNNKLGSFLLWFFIFLIYSFWFFN